jgi:hypothetical protein
MADGGGGGGGGVGIMDEDDEDEDVAALATTPEDPVISGSVRRGGAISGGRALRRTYTDHGVLQGPVHRTISASTIDAWSDVLAKWGTTSRARVRTLARAGIPDALRHQIWSRLLLSTGGPTSAAGDELSQSFQHLIKQESENEETIRCDLTRTFPAHEFFTGSASSGQAALYNISKAYSVYDEEVGYCQGFSFIIAELVLHVR